MPEPIAKGRILEAIDVLSRDSAKLERLLRDLNAAPNDLGQVALDNGIVNAQERTHLETDWFTNWWPGVDVQAILARGFTEAIEIALKKPGLPMDCYWICHEVMNTIRLHVDVCWSPYQVTVLINTPMPGRVSIPAAPLAETDPIKIIRMDYAGTSLEVVQPRRRA
ncbi:MAG: hypothetical protein WD904_08020 [Dehalococcoidia bacterium]